MSVCMFLLLSLWVGGFVSEHISKTTRPTITKFSTHVARGRGLVVLWRRCDTLCTSGFAEDVMLSHNVQAYKKTETGRVPEVPHQEQGLMPTIASSWY